MKWVIDGWLVQLLFYGSVPFLNASFKGTRTGISSQEMKRLKPGWNLVEIWLIWVIWHVDYQSGLNGLMMMIQE